MSKKPFFSIVIPTYNRANDLQFALFCILRQSFGDFEIIVCDNDSSDNTQNVVQSFQDKRIRYIKNIRNIGDKRNYKKAINLARGSYIFLHGDDDFIFRKSSLKKIADILYKYNPGFLRANYLCRTPNKKLLFDFVPNRVFEKNMHLVRRSKGIDIVNFILNTDAFFITGIIFKNSLPKNISIIYTEPCSWIEILLYSAITHGAYFIAEQHIVASWSKWRTDIHGNHVLFDIVQGRLQTEEFFQAVKKRISKEEYDEFLYQQLRKIYVCMFPAVKFFTGNNNLLHVSRRIRFIHRRITHTIVFKMYLFLSLLTPRFILGFVREYFFFKFTRLNDSSVSYKIMRLVRRLYVEYHRDYT